MSTTEQERKRLYGKRRTLKTRLRRTADWLEANPHRWGRGSLFGLKRGDGRLTTFGLPPTDDTDQLLANPAVCFCAYGAAAVANGLKKATYDGLGPETDRELSRLLNEAWIRTGIPNGGRGLRDAQLGIIDLNDRAERAEDVVAALRKLAETV